jgi:hypothetical protein
VSLPLWRTRKIFKGEFYNRQNVVCKDLGIVLKGIFRIYYYDLVPFDQAYIANPDFERLKNEWLLARADAGTFILVSKRELIIQTLARMTVTNLLAMHSIVR